MDQYPLLSSTGDPPLGLGGIPEQSQVGSVYQQSARTYEISHLYCLFFVRAIPIRNRLDIIDVLISYQAYDEDMLYCIMADCSNPRLSRPLS